MRASFVLAEVLQGLRRNVSMVVSVVLVTFVSLTFVGAAALMQLQIVQMKGFWYDKAQVVVYLCVKDDHAANCGGQGVTEAQVSAIRGELEGGTLRPYVKSVGFENYQQAYQHFVDRFGDDSTQSQLASPGLLPQAFYVSLANPEQSEVIRDAFASAPGVESVYDQRALLEPIFDGLNAASYSAIGIAALMLVAAVLLISTTIRLSAFTRRRELAIMRLVGASNRFIQTPFVLEGVIAALIGAAMASAAVVLLAKFFIRGYLAAQFPTIGFVGLRQAAMVSPLLLAIGVLLAALASGFAIRRYLRA